MSINLTILSKAMQSKGRLIFMRQFHRLGFHFSAEKFLPKHRLYLVGFLLLFCLTPVHAQLDEFENVEDVANPGFFKTYFKGLFKDFTDLGDPLSVNGGIGLNARTYNAWGTDNRQPPFYWILNANLNIQIYKINLPLSALISINRTEFTPPSLPGIPPVKENITNRFNRIGISPYYKWIKLHAGHRNMDFSQFTLANLTYLGGGVELTPGNVRFSTMYGRLAQAEPRDLSLLEPNLEVFERLGWGVKLGYGSNEEYIDLMLFRAWDDLNSIPDANPQLAFANENLVMGIKAQKTLFDKVRLSVDYGNSALNTNSADALTGSNQFPRPSFLFEERTNTAYSNALDATVDYEGSGYNIGLKYRRIDPNYRSLGAYFFDNDIEDYTANASWSMFQQQVQISGSAGLQRDNLDDSKPSTLTRFIGSTNINYTKDKFNLGLTYSNYSSDIAYVLDQELDSLNVVVVTQDAGFNASYTFSDKSESQHTFTFAANLQDVTDDIADGQQSAASQMLNMNLVYAYSLPESWRFNANWNYNQNMLAMMDMKRWGAGVGASRTFLENKLNAGMNLNYFRTTVETLTNIRNQTLNFRLRASYRINKAHSLNVNFNLLNRRKSDDTGTDDAFSEGIGNLGYRYNFSWQPKKKGTGGTNE